MVTEASSTRPPTAFALRVASVAGLLLIGLLMLAATGWGVLALHYWDHANATLCDALAVAWGLASLALIVGFSLRRWRWWSLGAFTALFVLVLAARGTVPPPH